MLCNKSDECGSEYCYHAGPHDEVEQCESRLCEWLRLMGVRGRARRVECEDTAAIEVSGLRQDH